MALQQGALLGGDEIDSFLGAGGMGEVYRARDRKLGRELALKLLLEEVASDPDRLARFDREAQVLDSLDLRKTASASCCWRSSTTGNESPPRWSWCRECLLTDNRSIYG
jgi:serine/threonine protein kinase